MRVVVGMYAFKTHDPDRHGIIARVDDENRIAYFSDHSPFRWSQLTIVPAQRYRRAMKAAREQLVQQIVREMNRGSETTHPEARAEPSGWVGRFFRDQDRRRQHRVIQVCQEEGEYVRVKTVFDGQVQNGALRRMNSARLLPEAKRFTEISRQEAEILGIDVE